jgi:hypothetical protein
MNERGAGARLPSRAAFFTILDPLSGAGGIFWDRSGVCRPPVVVDFGCSTKSVVICKGGR